jgi:methanogenic corrinoid protein MtbC1
VLVGGGAWAGREDLWRRSGADGFAASPTEAVRIARELLAS